MFEKKVFVQKITVNTKGGLIAAFECATNNGTGFYPSELETQITLERKSGITQFNLWGEDHEIIKKYKSNIRKIKAKDLLA